MKHHDISLKKKQLTEYESVVTIMNWTFSWDVCQLSVTGLILGLHPANERWRYKVTPSLIGRAQI